MRRALFSILCACGAVLAPIAAQEGHPLTGTWHGSWSTGPNQIHDVTFVMNWDGKNITGVINPGFDSMPIQNARLDPAGWAVHFETTAKDGARVVIDGKIQDVTNPRRAIVGTWTQGNIKADFRITRDQ